MSSAIPLFVLLVGKTVPAQLSPPTIEVEYERWLSSCFHQLTLVLYSENFNPVSRNACATGKVKRNFKPTSTRPRVAQFA